jgi:hypothetical protein
MRINVALSWRPLSTVGVCGFLVPRDTERGRGIPRETRNAGRPLSLTLGAHDLAQVPAASPRWTPAVADTPIHDHIGRR